MPAMPAHPKVRDVAGNEGGMVIGSIAQWVGYLPWGSLSIPLLQWRFFLMISMVPDAK